MEFLYVCSFSNGHIKVGRSIDPVARIASHASRVACMGIRLLEHKTFPVVDDVIAREARLIERCSERATQQHQNEWFVGCRFDLVCNWAEAIASEAASPAKESIWVQCLAVLQERGLSQTQIAQMCGCGQATISDLQRGGTREPRYSLGVKLLALADAPAKAGA